MTDFDLFSKIDGQDIDPTISKKSTPTQRCSHHTIVNENDSMLCTDCGLEMNQYLKDPKDWTYFQANEPKQHIDPTRCYIRKHKNKTIFHDVEHLNISDHIKDIANNIYIQICGNKVHRGAFRKAIVFATIFHAYKLDHNPQSCEKLIQLFKIKRKNALKGLKFINEHAPKCSPLRTFYITPEHLIHEFMKKLNATQEQIHEVIQLYHSIRGRSQILNRSRPQSTGAAVIWVYIKMTNRNISMKEFIQHVHLSELTINKISKEIFKILNNQKTTSRLK